MVSVPSARWVGWAAGGAALAGLVLLVSPLHVLAAVLLLVSVATLCFSKPGVGLWLVLLLFAIHPLTTKVAQANLGVTGTSLLLLSAWKEVALLSVLTSLTIAWIAARRGVGSLRVEPRLVDLIAGVLIVLVAIGLVLRPNALALNTARLMLFPIGVYFALRIRPIDGARLIWATVAIAVGISAFGIIQSSFFGFSFVQTYWGRPDLPIPGTFIAQYLDGPRASGTFGSPNELGFALAAYAAMAMSLLVVKPQGSRWAIAALFVILVGLALTFSRSAIVAGVAGIAILVIASWRASPAPRRTLTYLTIAIVPAVVLSGAIYEARGGTALLASTVASFTSVSATDAGSGNTPGQNIGDGAHGDTDLNPSTEQHLTSLASGWAIVRAHPWGLGLGTVGSRADPLTSTRPQYIIESWYLTMGVSLGWLGLVWAIAVPLSMLLTAISALRRGRTLIGLALVGIAVAVAIISFWLPTMLQPQIAIIPWSLTALAAARIADVTPRPARAAA